VKDLRPITLDVLEGNIALLAEKERLERDKQRLQELDRLKNEFLARVSHDLRTPLNSIIGFSELLTQEVAGKLNKKQADFIAAINRNGYTLLSLINDLLDLASIESGQLNVRREPVPLQGIVDDVRAATEPQLAKHKVTWPAPEAIAGKTVNVDRRRVTQAVMNLVDNSRKFTEPGGTIDISAGVDRDRCWFTVADNGLGIPEEDQGQLFKSFFQRQGPKQKNGGVGLGLAIVRGIAELHQGKAELVSSAPGRGTRFSVWFAIGSTP
jgi:signal transduction histidine kinase